MLKKLADLPYPLQDLSLIPTWQEIEEDEKSNNSTSIPMLTMKRDHQKSEPAVKL